MGRTMPVAHYCRKPGRQIAGPHCRFGSRYVNTVMGIDSLLSKSTFLRKMAQRIDSVVESKGTKQASSSRNGVSIEAPDQKLSRSEVADE
ncbi:hypothetical protein PIB30_059717 [Stylosanthes scabra]|uniref:Uncharacterized protein n=1 Tax=Stylosanthes scabra TaxID=79078 RepID=A0ABU6XLL5_9FABA|nr:hypothetical protein [Stylosanthes scabra]